VRFRRPIGLIGRGCSSRINWTTSGGLLLYAFLGLIANWPTWPGDPGRIRSGKAVKGNADLDQMVWFLGWTPHALSDGHNLFSTNALNYPQGVNLAQNTVAPLLGILTAPLTLLVSPIASLNLLLWATFPLSAASAFFVLRRWVSWDVAALIGGLLYGFSPYVVAQGAHHLMHAFVPLPPLIFLSVYELLRDGQTRPRRWGVTLGLLVTAQFFISAEIAATTVIVASIAIIVVGTRRLDVVLPTMRRAAGSLALAVGIVLAAVAYPAWVMLTGPHRYEGPAYPGGLNGDLLGPVLPTSLQGLAPESVATSGDKLLYGNLSENGAYLGLPLLVLMLVLVLIAWRRPWMRFAAAMVVATSVLTLGHHLVVANRDTGIPLPFDLLASLPLLDNILAVRFSLYVAFFAAFVVALGLDELRDQSLATRQPGGLPATNRRRLGGIVGALVAASALSLMPRWPFPSGPAAVPSYFTSDAVRRIPEGDVVLISPYPSVAQAQPQMWQSVAGMRFKIIGGYALSRGAGGSSTVFPAVLQPERVQRFLWARASRGAPYPDGPVPEADARLACDLRLFLKRYDVGTILVSRVGANPDAVAMLYTQALGKPSAKEGGVTAWYHVRETLARDPTPVCEDLRA
jgi:hypothetical protein